MEPMQSGAPEAPQSGMPGAAPQSPAGMPKPALPKAAVVGIAVVAGLAVVGFVGKMVVNKMTEVAVRKGIEATTGVKVDEDGSVQKVTTKDGTMEVKTGTEGSGTMTFTDKDGKTAQYEYSGGGEGAATLPKDFPGDFPQPPGGTLTGSFSAAAEGMQTFTTNWTTTKTVAEVRAYYDAELKAKGWRIVGTTEIEGSVSMVFERGPEDAEKKDGGWLSITTEEGKTTVGLVLGLNMQQ